MNPAKAQTAARSGALRLDEVRPAWFLDVDLDTLDIGSAQRCVLGQVFEVHGRMYNRPGFTYVYEGYVPEIPHGEFGRLGFVSSADVYYDQLTEAWKEEINCRRRQYNQQVAEKSQEKEAVHV